MLPEVRYPIHSLTLPSDGRRISYRGYNTREHRSLLHSIEVANSGNFVDIILELVKACVRDDLDVENLPMYDIDYIYMNLRINSVGDVVPIEYRCVKENDSGEPCNGVTRAELNLSEIKVVVPDDYEQRRVIKIDEKSGLVLKAPTFRMYRNLAKDQKLQDEFIIFECMESIYDGDEVFIPNTDFSEEEFVTFFGKLPARVQEAAHRFFRDLPYIALITTITCGKCGNQEQIEIRELEDFFV